MNNNYNKIEKIDGRLAYLRCYFINEENIKNRYDANNVNYQMQNIDDMKKIFGLEMTKDVKGFSELSLEDQKIFTKWTLDSLNLRGFRNRAYYIPTEVWKEDNKLKFLTLYSIHDDTELVVGDDVIDIETAESSHIGMHFLSYKNIQRRYDANNVKYQMKSLDDITKIFGLKMDNVEGFSELSIEDQEVFAEGILKYINRFGLDNRIDRIPTRVWKENGEFRMSILGSKYVEFMDKEGFVY